MNWKMMRSRTTFPFFSFLANLLLLAFLCLQVNAQGRRYRTENSRAIRDFEEARKMYDSRQDQKALRLLESALSRDSAFLEARFLMAQLHLEGGRLDDARLQLRTMIAIDARYLPQASLLAGEMEFAQGNYKSALADFERFQQLDSRGADNAMNDVVFKINCCRFALEALAAPVPFAPVNLGPSINSSDGEYFPSFTVDQREIIFTRDVRDKSGSGIHQEDFYIAKMSDTVWQTARNAGEPLNSRLNEGGPAISVDGRILFFTACDRPDGQGSCDIYLSRRMADDSWSKPFNLGPPVNTAAWESQPSFSSDGKTLYFIRGSYDRNRNRLMDIYSTTFREDMTWGEPVRLSDSVNTSGREESVFIHPDNKTLYFSSDGHVGMGGSDIFVSRRHADGSWSKPVNLGYPINTHGDENSLVVSADASCAYFASDRPGGYGDLDLYRFSLYAGAKPALVSYAQARVTDAISGDPLAAAFEIIDVATGKVILANTTDRRRGEFLACLPAGKSYMLNVSKDGYLFYSDYFDCKEATDRQHAYKLDIALHRPVPGKSVVLKNIFFDVNSFQLRPESFPELNKLAALLKNQAEIRIEVSGHTDNTGDKKANLQLSENRARAVVDFLVQKGIEPSRITAKGYGETQPKTTNDTDEGRSANRRTEFRVL